MKKKFTLKMYVPHTGVIQNLQCHDGRNISIDYKHLQIRKEEGSYYPMG